MIEGLSSFFKKNTYVIIALGLFIIAYLFLRLYNITSLPLFTDEAIYTRWAQIARFDAAWRFISLTDGKQPSFVWLDMIFMRFVNDPLLAGRLVSVAAGIGSVVGLFFLASEVFKNNLSRVESKRIGLFASFLYVVFPFALVYDRMVLYDSLVATGAIWALYFEILLVRRVRLDLALILGMIIGAGVLTKTSAFFFIYLLPFSLLLFNFSSKDRAEKVLKWVLLASISVILAYAFYMILRLSPFFHIINDKNEVFVYPIKEWLDHPFRFLLGNLRGQVDWFVRYFTVPGIILILVSLFDKNYIREKLFLLVWFLAPFLALAFFGKVLYPRFIFFMMMPLLVLAAYGIEMITIRFRHYYVRGIVVLIFILLMLRSDFYILTNFAEAPIPALDLKQYINGWPAGGGTDEIISFLNEKSKSGKIYVASEGTFGSLPTYAVEIYLGDNRKVEKRGIYPIPPDIPEDLLLMAKKMPVYFIFNQSQTPPISWPLRFIAKYQKGIANSYMSLYEVLPK